MVSWLQLLNIIQILLATVCNSVVFQLDSSNYQSTKNGYQLTIITYSAQWCPFSRQLKPILDEASEKIVNLTSTGVAAFGIVDCVAHSDLCISENVRKYPTVKYALYGEIQPQEYRNTRSVDALTKFINEHIKHDITFIEGQNQTFTEALVLVNSTAASIVGLFATMDPASLHQQYFRRAALIHKSRCSFYFIHNLQDMEDRLAHIEEYTRTPKEVTVLKSADYPSLSDWIKSKCVRYVRELNFDNAEEITDEGLEMLILFYVPGKHDHLKPMFIKFLKQHMLGEIGKLNFVMANGKTFSHPLMHLDKKEEDLPLLVADSLAHMYTYKGNVEESFDVNQPQRIQQFISDLHSGKLHREFHYGSDDDKKAAVDKQPEANQPNSNQPGGNKLDTKLPDFDQRTDPPESAMKKLSPSRLRYSLLHDEF